MIVNRMNTSQTNLQQRDDKQNEGRREKTDEERL